MVRGLWVLSLVAVAGCTGAADRVVPEPTDIRLEGAMESVVRAFRRAQEVSAETGQPIGLYPCTVTVTFNITAGGTNRREIVLDANVTPPARIVQGALGLTATSEQTQTASRGNQIAILLTSAACNPPNTLGTLRPQVTFTGPGGTGPLFRTPTIARQPTPEEMLMLERLFRERSNRTQPNQPPTR